MNNAVKMSLAGAAGLAVGALVSNYITVKYMNKQFMNVIESEMEAMNEHFSAQQARRDRDRIERFQKSGRYATPEEALEAASIITDYSDSDSSAAELVSKLMDRKIADIPELESDDEPDVFPGNPEDEDEDEVLPETLNVYEQSAILDDEGAPIQDPFFQERDHQYPYIVSIGEFHNTEDDFSKISVVWYEGDDILTDENGRTVDNYERIIGSDFAGRFGDHSDDKNVVYVRNRDYASDYEVTRNKRAFFQDAIDGPSKKKTQRMRPEEE